jgi:anti-sigma B factor antagonist
MAGAQEGGRVSFDVRHTTVREVPVLVVTGELDLLAAPRLADEVAAALAGDPAVLAIDLSGTTFLDSGGVRQVVRSARGAGQVGTTVQVVCPPENHPVRLVFDLLSIDRFVPVLPSADLIGADPRP